MKTTVRTVAEAQAIIQTIAPATYKNYSLFSTGDKDIDKYIKRALKKNDEVSIWYSDKEDNADNEYCVYTDGYGKAGVKLRTWSASENDYNVVAEFEIDYNAEEKAEVEIEEYAVSEEAQEVATQAEIENASQNKEYTVRYYLNVTAANGWKDSEEHEEKADSHEAAREIAKQAMTKENFEMATIETANGFKSYHVYKAEEASEVTVANFAAEVEKLVCKIEDSKALGEHVTVKELEKKLSEVWGNYEQKLVCTTLAMEYEEFDKLFEDTVEGVKNARENAEVERIKNSRDYKEAEKFIGEHDLAAIESKLEKYSDIEGVEFVVTALKRLKAAVVENNYAGIADGCQLIDWLETLEEKATVEVTAEDDGSNDDAEEEIELPKYAVRRMSKYGDSSCFDYETLEEAEKAFEAEVEDDRFIYVELMKGYKVIRSWEKGTQCYDVSDYAVTPEAFEVAVQAEVDNASSIQFNLQAANDAEEPEKIFVAYVSRFDGLSYHRKGEKFFNNATDAFNYLAKKKYKNDNWELVIEVWDSEEDYYKYSGYGAFEEEHKIYTNSPDFDEYSTNAEIQKLIEERDAKAEVESTEVVKDDGKDFLDLLESETADSAVEKPAEEVIEYTCVTLRKGSCSGGYFNPEKRFSTLNGAVKYALVDKSNRFDWDEYYDGALVTINDEKGLRGIWRITAEGNFETLDASECADIDTDQSVNIEKDIVETLNEIKYCNQDIERAKSRMENAKYWGKTEEVSIAEKDLLKEEKAKAKELSKLAEFSTNYPKIYAKAIKVEKEKYGAYFNRTYSGIATIES